MPRHAVTLQRRHFELIADLLASTFAVDLPHRPLFSNADRDRIVGAWADRLADTNSGFRRDRFIERSTGLVWFNRR